MNKKVIDIFPPQKEEASLKEDFSEEKEERVEEVKEEKFKPEKPKKKAGGFSFSRNIVFLGLFLLFVAFVFCYFSLSRANIEIWPRAESLSLNTTVKVSQAADQVDFINKVIPGTVLRNEKTVADNFAASTKSFKEGKAEGVIRVYNEYSTSPQGLIPNTRFISKEGMIFRTPVRVTIPGGRYEGGKFVAGEIDIEVVADQPGSEYNIGPTTFSIPGFAGTNLYTKFYAKSFQTMSGGFSDEVSLVSEEDLEGAEETLTKRAKEESEASFKEKLGSENISSEFYFAEKAFQTEIVSTFCLVGAGDEAEEFNFQVKAKTETLIFKKEDLKSFVIDFINSRISKESKIDEESLEISYSLSNLDLNSGDLTLSLNISSNIYTDIDIAAFKNALRGKTLMETKAFLENQPEVVKAKAEFWPFWVRKAPEDLDKINFDLIIDPSLTSDL